MTMRTLHSPGTDGKPRCGLPSTPRTAIANDPYTFLGVWGRFPSRTCSRCLAALRTSSQFQLLFKLIDERLPSTPTS